MIAHQLKIHVFIQNGFILKQSFKEDSKLQNSKIKVSYSRVPNSCRFKRMNNIQIFRFLVLVIDQFFSTWQVEFMKLYIILRKERERLGNLPSLEEFKEVFSQLIIRVGPRSSLPYSTVHNISQIGYYNEQQIILQNGRRKKVRIIVSLKFVQ